MVRFNKNNNKYRKINELKYRFNNRNSFRLTKTKDGDKYRVSKRLKNKMKSNGIGFVRKLCSKPMNLIDFLMRFGIYKKTLSLKLIFVLIPFVVLNITDSFVISVVITTINIFCCYLMFSFAITNKEEAIVDGKFDYGMYKTIKAKKETIAIIIMCFVSLLLILLGHYYLESLMQIFASLVVDV